MVGNLGVKDVNFTQAQCHIYDLQGGVDQIINPPVAHQVFYRAQTFSFSRMMCPILKKLISPTSLVTTKCVIKLCSPVISHQANSERRGK